MAFVLLLWTLLGALWTCGSAEKECLGGDPDGTFNFKVTSRRNETGYWIVSVDSTRNLQQNNTGEFIFDVGQVTTNCNGSEVVKMVTTATIEPSPGRGTVDEGTMSHGMLEFAEDSTEDPEVSKETYYAGYTEFEGFGRYKVYHETLNWYKAREICIGDGGDLIALDSEDKRKEVFTKLKKKQSTWIGVHDPSHTGNWVTVRGHPVPSTLWQDGEPGGIFRGFCTYGMNTGHLYDTDCEFVHEFICEIL